MKFKALLATLIISSCAHQHPHHVAEKSQHSEVYREIANLRVDEKEMSPRQINRKLKKIFHSYVIGQRLLEKFDAQLDKTPTTALHSQTYAELQVVRANVDLLEEDLINLQIKLVAISSLPKYTEKEKTHALRGLNLIENFLSGKDIPESLRHMVLGNLREKQGIVLEHIQDISQDENLTQNQSDSINSLAGQTLTVKKNKSKLVANIQKYFVKKNELKDVATEFEKDSDFKNYVKEIKTIAKSLHANERALESEIITPSTGKAGNITGNTFPAKTWSLTYDDGPNAKNSPSVLKVLNDKDVKATFFMLAKQVEALPSTAKSIVSSGMDIASHSYDHPQLTKLSGAGLDKQISTSKKVIENKLGVKVKLFRLPYGAGVSNATIRGKIAAEKMVHVFWNVDTLDWQDKNPTSIYNRTVKQMANSSKNSGVILFHDIHAQTIEASRLVIEHMKKNGLKLCTVQGVIDQVNKNTSDCK